ncbi:uncharacterized protein YALI1_D02488g [Yarrowia lipolytica]|uniref:Uncharacterized protein n=1 Tax=Yarrowia lipolytica TaxID=4952 RepID=A0A1D8NCV7_YARLL|nr:hypothetical protein YALI1_D02488g [Yarrowia lipolytica]
MPLFWQASVFRGNHDRCAFYFIVGRPVISFFYGKNTVPVGLIDTTGVAIVANQYNLPEYWCISLKSNKKGHVDVNTAFEAWRPTKKHCFIGSTYQRYRMYPVASINRRVGGLGEDSGHVEGLPKQYSRSLCNGLSQAVGAGGDVGDCKLMAARSG